MSFPTVTEEKRHLGFGVGISWKPIVESWLDISWKKHCGKAIDSYQVLND